jgi:hypothetical protein
MSLFRTLHEARLNGFHVIGSLGYWIIEWVLISKMSAHEQ